MPEGRVGEIGREMGRLFTAGAMGSLSDAELLGRFVEGRGRRAEAAFEAIVDRHGPMISRVCRAGLDGEDARDAYQATFLVFLRRADSIRRPESLASWLHGVAARICARSRSDRDRRQRIEKRRAGLVETRSEETRSDPLAFILREEIERLPSKYRSAIVLCDLEELSYEEAARRSELPIGTIKSRLSRGRALLRSRLTRQGLAPSAGIAALLATATRVEAVPPGWHEVAVRLFTIDDLASACEVSSRLAARAVGALRMATVCKLVLWTLGLSTLTLAGAGTLARTSPAPDDPGPKPVPAPAAVPRPADPDFDRAFQAIGAIDDGERKADALLTLALAQLDREDRNGSLATLRLALVAVAKLGPEDWALHRVPTVEMSKIHPHTLVRIAVAQARAGDRKGAEETLRRVDRVAHEVKIKVEGLDLLRGVVTAFVAIGDRDEASKVFAEAKRFSADVDREKTKLSVPGTLARMRADLGQTDEALALLVESKPEEEQEGWSRAVFPLIEIVGVVGATDRPNGAKDLEKVLRTAEELTSGRGRAVVQKEVAVALAQRGDREGAVKLAAAIDGGEGDGREPRMQRSYKAMAYQETGSLQAEAGDLDGARVSFREALRLIDEIDRDHPGSNDPLDVRTHVGVAQARLGDIEEALETAKILSNKSSVVYVFEAVSKAQDKAGDLAGAAESLRRAKAAAERFLHADGLGGELNDYQRMILACLLARSGDGEDALQAAEEIVNERWRGQALEGIARVQGEAGDVAATLEWIANREPAEARARAFQGLAQGLRSRKPTPSH